MQYKLRKLTNYFQITFQDILPEQAELLVAELTMTGFEGFEEEGKTLKAFIPAGELDTAALDEIAKKYRLSFTQTTIEATNWNAVWESNFQPVIVDDFVGIRADFHQPIKGVEQEIIITPKMSFGTGHHATTYMMIKQMREIDFNGRTVFDFGTGTGVLSILAEKLSAASITAVDNDDWSIANTEENLERNDCSAVTLIKADTLPPGEKYDIILANINKNVILENFSSLAVNLSPKGILLLSGLLEEDEQAILTAAGSFPLVLSVKETRNNWLALRFDH